MTRETTPDDRRGPARGEAERIVVEETVEDDDLEYLPDSREIRYVAMYRRVGPPQEGPGSREPIYETIPFEWWGHNKCASVGASRVSELVREATGEPKAISSAVFEQDDGRAISIESVTTLGRSGEVLYEPSITLDDLVTATPRAVDVTVRLADQEHAETVPVWAKAITERLE